MWDYNYFVRLVPFSEAEKTNIKEQVEAQTNNSEVFIKSQFIFYSKYTMLVYNIFV